MAKEVNAGENYEFSDLLMREPSGKTRRLISGAEIDDYHSVINFHGNRNESLEFISEIKRNIDFEDSVTVNFNVSTGLESAYIDDVTLKLKVKDINFERDNKYIDDFFDLEFYEVSIEDDKREIFVPYSGEYTITAKEQSVNKEDVEFLVKLACQKKEQEIFNTEPVSQFLKFPVENKAMQIVEFSPYLFQATFSSEDKNGVEPVFKEQVENILKNIPNLNYTVEIDEPYLDENRHRVENYLKINEDGNIQIYGIPKELGENKEADRTFKEMKQVLQEHYNAGKEIFATCPEFALKLLEGPRDDMKIFDKNDKTQYAFSGTIKYDDQGHKEIKKLDTKNTFMESSKNSLKMLWKDFQKYSNFTTDIFELSGKNSIYSISDCKIIGLESFNIVHSEQIANYDILDLSRENDLKLLVVDDSNFSPYGFRENETWALIENGNIKIAMSEEKFNELIKTAGGRTEAIENFKKNTELERTEKRFKNIEIQIYKNDRNWNDDFFLEKGIAEKIMLKQEKKEKIENKNKKEIKKR